MKIAAVVLALGSCALFAQDPVTPVSPVQTVWTVAPVTAQLLAVLESPASTPAQIQALVAQLTPGQLAQVAASIIANPAVFTAFVAQLSSAQLLSVIPAFENAGTLSTLVAGIGAAQAAGVLAGLQHSPRTLADVVASLNPATLEQAKIRLFITDVTAWAALSSFLAEPLPTKPFANSFMTSRHELAARIAREGYTPELLALAQKLMQEDPSK